MSEPGWTNVPRLVALDPTLSYRASGLYCFLLTEPPGPADLDALAAETPRRESRAQIAQALDELTQAGYYDHERGVIRP
jgi:hypothetical protein